ncbi:MAG: phenylalanine--tRNA ligase subunit beta [Bacteroidetes bacterium]|nr:phenylalanine--tRNA ligase subunit beta [Bacteroidota bacterium]
MIISLNWLKTLINIDLSEDELSDLLTNTGLEVEKLHHTESVKGGLKNLIVGEVLTCEKHPDADRLSVTTVDLGNGEIVQIVCGAPNVAAGQKVVVAPVGCTIHPLKGEAFEIRKAKIRGQVSEGMICAEDEIGLGESHDGILVLDNNPVPGTPAADIFTVEKDVMIEIGLTPNRGDAASHLGVARDVKAVTGAEIQKPEVSELSGGGQKWKIELPFPVMCPRYSGISLKNVKVGPSPDWLQKRLKSIELKPINNVVDVTNFVLHELGQPIHAFDADKISGDTIIVRPANEGEVFTTLDGTERKLTGNELLIADKEKALAQAGVFGGLHSGVTALTTRLFIESAYFNPATVRKSARSQSLSTDASFRYERGCDPEITVYALKRVVDLLKEVAGAEIESEMVDAYPQPLEQVKIDVDLDWLNMFCGTNIPEETVKSILLKLDFKIIHQDKNNLQIEAPLYRSDVTRAVDVAEEVLRIYGYNQVEIPTRLHYTPAIQEKKSMREMTAKLMEVLTGVGFSEIMNNSQTRKEFAGENAVEILNPLSAELAVMRTDLTAGMLASMRYNLNRKNSDLLFFEIGKTYQRNEGKYSEKNVMAIAATGNIRPSNWTTNTSRADLYFVKGAVKICLKKLGIDRDTFSQNIRLIDSKTLKKHDLKAEIWYVEIDLDQLLKQYRKASFKLKDVPVFPVVNRDLSLITDDSVSYEQIDTIVKKSCGGLYYGGDVFDVYTGDKIPSGKKSYAISISLYDSEKTLTDKTVDQTISKITSQLEKQLGITIRTS